MRFSNHKNTYSDILFGATEKNLSPKGRFKCQKLDKWRIMPLDPKRRQGVVLTAKDQVLIKLIKHYLENIERRAIFSSLYPYLQEALEQKSLDKYHVKYILMLMWIKKVIRLERRVTIHHEFKSRWCWRITLIRKYNIKKK